MAYPKHVLFEVYMLALGSKLALKFPPLQGIKFCIVTANIQMSCFLLLIGHTIVVDAVLIYL